MLDLVKKVENFEILKSWILEKVSPGKQVDDDFDLIENRVITSLKYVELLLLVEEMTNIPHASFREHVDKFRSLASIRSNFFS